MLILDYSRGIPRQSSPPLCPPRVFYCSKKVTPAGETGVRSARRTRMHNPAAGQSGPHANPAEAAYATGKFRHGNRRSVQRKIGSTVHCSGHRLEPHAETSPPM